jgi:hypothetical protein
LPAISPRSLMYSAKTRCKPESAGIKVFQVDHRAAFLPYKCGSSARFKTHPRCAHNLTLSIDNEAVLVISTLADTDADGVPDAYEVASGSNPNNPADSSADTDGDGPACGTSTSAARTRTTPQAQWRLRT